MAKVALGKKIPDFKFTATNNTTHNFSDLQGHNVILYFYPRDNTPGCTTEGCDFNTQMAKLKKLNTLIFGISRDSLTSHEKFKADFNFQFELITDPDEAICQLFDVIKLKNIYGKQVRAIERSTFLIDQQGVLRYEWRNVKVPDHVAEVLASIENLNN